MMAVLQSTVAFRDLHFVFVTGAPDFDSGPAQDVIEYLRHVSIRGPFEGVLAMVNPDWGVGLE